MSKTLRKEVIEWSLFLGIGATLYLTGLHTPIIGTLQRGLLATGILQPNRTDGEIAASYEMILEDFDGNELNLSEWKNETIFINYWATWCAPCIAEMPDINDLYSEVNDQVRFALISVDKDRQKARDFMARKEFDFPVYFMKSSVPDVYATNSIPTTYVVSPEGKIVVSNKGMAKYSGEKFKSFLRDL